MNELNITSAQYVADMDSSNTIVKTVIDGVTLFVPLDTANRHYAEILKQIDAGTLTIADAD